MMKRIEINKTEKKAYKNYQDHTLTFDKKPYVFEVFLASLQVSLSKYQLETMNQLVLYESFIVLLIFGWPNTCPWFLFIKIPSIYLSFKLKLWSLSLANSLA